MRMASQLPCAPFGCAPRTRISDQVSV